MKIIFIIFFLIISSSNFAKEKKVNIDVQNSISLVLGLGLSFAILGLSTLPFEPEPHKKLDIITKGAAIGLILGVLISLYSNSEGALSNKKVTQKGWKLNPDIQLSKFNKESIVNYGLKFQTHF